MINRPLTELQELQITAYAMGELPENEAKELESLMADHPLMQKELAATRDMMGMLHEEFLQEWSVNAAPAVSISRTKPADLAAPSGKIVPLATAKKDFGKPALSRANLLSLAAVLTGMLVVGSLVLQPQRHTGRNFAALSPATEKAASHNPSNVSVDFNALASVDEGNGPALRLAEEVSNFDDILSELDKSSNQVDDSYLSNDGGQMVLTSWASNQPSATPAMPLAGVDNHEGFDLVLLDELRGQGGDLALDAIVDYAESIVNGENTPRGKMKTFTRSENWSGTGSKGAVSYTRMHSALSDIAIELEKNSTDGLSARDTQRLKQRMDEALGYSRQVGEALSTKQN